MTATGLARFVLVLGASLSWPASQAVTPGTASPRCPSEFGAEPRTPAEHRRRAEWVPYQRQLPLYEARLPGKPDRQLVMPVSGVRVRQVRDTFARPRGGGRLHEGQDIFAPRNTPVYSAAAGFVWRISETPLGGKWVFTVGAGGRRYYYAHLERFAAGLREGQRVTTSTLLGYVGTTGNARDTPAHLHFEVNEGSQARCDYRAIDPLPLLVDRPPKPSDR
ncbi:M23 family metallopeptidase [Deinococcus peraridilitoris]|nr:M23 family metallopeptidase [Deinococcus peraridilitoris]